MHKPDDSESPRKIEVIGNHRSPDNADELATTTSSRRFLVVAVLLALSVLANCATAWFVYRQADINRQLNCASLTIDMPADGDDLNHLTAYQKQVIDALHCKLPREVRS